MTLPIRTLDEAVAALRAAGGQAAHEGDTERLMTYWAEGEGAAKIGWGAPHDFDRCVIKLLPHLDGNVQETKGLCAKLHHRALGVWPGQEDGGRK